MTIEASGKHEREPKDSPQYMLPPRGLKAPITEVEGALKIVRWAESIRTEEGIQYLGVSLAERLHRMALSEATGEGLVTDGLLGVDFVRLGEGKKFLPHTHPGNHLLIVVGGLGTITYDGKIYPTEAGQVYLVVGLIPHVVGARTDHVILAVGSPHKAVDDPERMALVEYKDVLSPIGEMHCLIDDIKVDGTIMLHEVGCAHCPCPNC